jgi:hypothetical protein
MRMRSMIVALSLVLGGTLADRDIVEQLHDLERDLTFEGTAERRSLQQVTPTPAASPSGCFSDPSSSQPIPNCACHSTCNACGYNPGPTGASNCITCADGSSVTPVYSGGTGTCASTQTPTATPTPTICTVDGSLNFNGQLISAGLVSNESCAAVLPWLAAATCSPSSPTGGCANLPWVCRQLPSTVVGFLQSAPYGITWTPPAGATSLAQVCTCTCADAPLNFNGQLIAAGVVQDESCATVVPWMAGQSTQTVQMLCNEQPSTIAQGIQANLGFTWTPPGPTPVCGCEVMNSQFCSYDEGTTGDCESCSQASTSAACSSLDLPAAGATDCTIWCFGASTSMMADLCTSTCPPAVQPHPSPPPAAIYYPSPGPSNYPGHSMMGPSMGPSYQNLYVPQAPAPPIAPASPGQALGLLRDHGHCDIRDWDPTLFGMAPLPAGERHDECFTVANQGNPQAGYGNNERCSIVTLTTVSLQLVRALIFTRPPPSSLPPIFPCPHASVDVRGLGERSRELACASTHSLTS